MLIYMHVTYIVNYIHFTSIHCIIKKLACRLGLNINYWLIKNYIRKTPSNLRDSERGDVTVSVI